VDATVAEGALRRGDAVVTSNEDDVRRFADVASANLRIAGI